ncbi:RNA polymerase II mediator complex subunit [Microsporum ferrugineum]
MSESFSLPLRPVRKKTDETDTLPIRIAQINAQRGSFRDVTEESLSEEIEALRVSGKQASDIAEDIESGNDTDDKEQQLFTSRSEMLEFATQAQVEACYALDFVSLALSKYAPRQVELSMTPYVKLKIPSGSLGIDKIKTPDQTEADRRDIEVVSKGWKLESFSSAANNLLEAATRLQKEVAAETRYWSEVLAIKEKGWKICRLPRERQTLGVQHGFLEAAPVFRDRGLSALRRGDEGSLYVDQGIYASPPRVVRIRIQEDGNTVGVSQPACVKHDSNTSAQETFIHQARDCLFEEELFYELNREARALLRHGIETRHNQILFYLSDSRQVLVDMVPIDEAATLNQDATDDLPANDLAHAIACSIRILLTHAHRKNHRRRTQIPTAISVKKRQTAEYPLLQPSIAYLQHRSHTQWLMSCLHNITNTLLSAGLKCKYGTNNALPKDLPGTLPNHNKHIPLVESLVESFLNTQETKVSGDFLSPNSWYKILVRTDLGPTALGTEFTIRTTLTSLPQQQITQRFGTREDIKEFLIYLFTLDIVYTIPLRGGTKTVSSLPSTSEGEVATNTHGADEDRADIRTTVTEAAIWEPTFAENGELTAYMPGQNRNKKLRVILNEDSLVLHCMSMSSTEAGKVEDIRYLWTVNQTEEESHVTLQEALRRIENSE